MESLSNDSQLNHNLSSNSEYIQSTLKNLSMNTQNHQSQISKITKTQKSRITNQNIMNSKNQMNEMSMSKIKTSQNITDKRNITLDKTDKNDTSYDSVTDPIQVIIFDSEIHFRKDLKEIDIVFLVDTTRSSNPLLKGIKRFIRKLLFDAKKTLSQYEVESINLLKFGLIAYRDHDQENESYVSKILCELTGDKNKFREQLYNLDCKGGKDECEAILDGLDDAVNKMNWRNKSMKFIYHICGSPPHGSDINGGVNDDFLDGCPCGKNYQDVIEDLRGKGIDYTIVVVGKGLDSMIANFSKYCKIDVMVPSIQREDDVDGFQVNN